MSTKPTVSIVVPLFNEAQSVAPLHERILHALEPSGISFEIIFIDDGSTDRTFDEMRKLPSMRAIRFVRNFGQTAALAAGINKARGETIVTIDGDLENDPHDIPKLIAKLEEGFDVVSGWRKDRWRGQLLTRRIPSVIANWIISAATGAKLHDHGCALKAYRKNALAHLKLHGEMHRMIAAYATLFNRAKLTEMPVAYAPRQFGRSNYGILRSFKVMLDVVAIQFFYKYANRPIHFFGAAGFFCFFFGFLAFASMLYFKYGLGISFIETPLPTLTGMFGILGVQFVLMGLLAELVLRKSADTETFVIAEEMENVVQRSSRHPRETPHFLI